MAIECLMYRVLATPAKPKPANSGARGYWKKIGVCCGLALSIFSARAEAPPPPREFWDYLLEFTDESGELFDPADLAAVAKASADKESARDFEQPATPSATTRPDTSHSNAAAGDKQP